MKIKEEKKLNWIQWLIYSLILFLIIYNPPIYSGLSFTTIAVAFSVVFVITNNRLLFRILGTKQVWNLLKLFFTFFTYYLIISLVNLLTTSRDEIVTGIIDNTISYFSFFLVSFAITIWAIKKRISFDGLCKLYIAAGLIQTCIVMACLVSPSIKTLFNSMTVMNSSSSKIASSVQWTTYRNFGFASTLYDIFGFTMAILGIVALNHAIKGSKIYYVFSFFLAIAAVVNARSAFVIYIIGFVILLLSRSGKRSANWYASVSLFFVAVAIIVFFAFSYILNNTSSEHMVWMASAITDTSSLVGGEKEGYYDMLLNDFLFFPEGLSLFFGTGMTPQVAILKQSDVGYIQNLWMYGIVGSILLYLFYLNMFKIAIKELNWPDNALMKALSIMIAIYLIKLTPLGYSMASVIFGPLCFMVAYKGGLAISKQGIKG